MSIQYAVAAQLVDEQVLMEQISADKLNRPQLREFMTRHTQSVTQSMTVAGRRDGGPP